MDNRHFDVNDVEIDVTETAYRGFFKILTYRLRHRLFGGGWSEPMTRELFERGHAVAVLPYDPVRDKIGLIEQFRVGAIGAEQGPWCIEVIAGMLDAGYTAEEVAHKELSEEAGLENCTLEFISTYLSSPGGCSEQVHLYCALCDLHDAAGVFGVDSEHEDIRFSTYTPSEVFENMYRARTNNSATLIALQWLQLNRARIQHEHNDS